MSGGRATESATVLGDSAGMEDEIGNAAMKREWCRSWQAGRALASFSPLERVGLPRAVRDVTGDWSDRRAGDLGGDK